MSSVFLKKGEKIHTAFRDFTIQKQIGQGGNGVVYSAIDDSNNTFAIKTIRRDMPSVKLNRFRNEIYFCMNHNHENIIKILDYGTCGSGSEYLFYVMPLYNETLRDKMNKGISHDTAADIFKQILIGLQYAHDNGCFHRDIKPENILFLSDSDEPVIADFGIAHFCEEDIIATVETKSTERLANFQYAAPEQREKGTNVDGRADVYAAGLILNEMFTGKLVAGGNYKTIREVCEEYDYLDEVVEELYCQNPEDRIYPIDKILTDIEVRARRKEAKDLRNINSQDDNVAESLFDFSTPRIKDIDFSHNNLVITMSEDLPFEWYSILSSGAFSHNSFGGYNTNRFKGNGNQVIVAISPDEKDFVVKQVVDCFKSWIPIVTNIYMNNQKKRINDEHDRRIMERNREIERLEHEAKLKKMLNNMI